MACETRSGSGKEQAFAQWATWRRNGQEIDLSLNISSADFDALLIMRLEMAASPGMGSPWMDLSWSSPKRH